MPEANKATTVKRDVAAEKAEIVSELERSLRLIGRALEMVKTGDDGKTFDAARVFKDAVATFPGLYSQIRSSRTYFGQNREPKA